MAVGFSNTNKPLNPRGNDASPKGYNRAALYSGKALDFDGVNDNVDLDGFTLSGTNATICFNALATGANRYFFWVGGQNYGIINHDTLGFGIFDSATWNYFGTTERSKMSFYCVVNEGTTQRVYCNGVQIGGEETALAIDWSSPSKVLLGSNNAENEFLNGEISGVRVFNQVLTAAQVADLYNNPEKVVPTGVDNTALKLWLPMQEGAGTTALNGAPDALGSEVVTNGDFDTDSDWTKSAGWTIANGKATFDNSSGAGNLTQTGILEVGKTYVLTFDTLEVGGGNFAYSIGGGYVFINDIEANTTHAVIATASTTTLNLRGADNFTGSIDNVSVKEISNNGTISGATWTHGIGAPVAQTSVIDWNKHTLDGTNEVLVPQGLTSGRDLLGNLFENVRKQGALNLDGNSWAEVHDNASLDFGTGGFTLEVWAKISYENTGSSYNGILGLGNSLTVAATAYIYTRSAGPRFFINGTSFTIATTLDEGNWHHLVVTRTDAGAIQTYYDGAEGEDSGTEASTMTNALTKFIGRDANTTRYYQDSIAQPRIYNRALTAAEVLQNYNSGKNTYK